VRIVIVGATGNIGVSLVERLAGDRRVDDIVGVARRVPQGPLGSGAERVTWVSGDIRYDDLEQLVEDADVVVDLAWMFQPTHRPEVTWSTNVVGTSRLIDAVLATGVPTLVVSSSVAAYSPRAHTAPVDESWPTHGTSTAAYAREKAYVERLLDAAETTREHPRVVRIRPAFVFQGRSASEQRRIFAGPLLPRALVRPKLIPAMPVPDGLLLQAVHADDVANAFAKAALGDASGGFNICADDVLGPTELSSLVQARRVPVPAGLLRRLIGAAWTARAIPADPKLFDAVMALPVMSNARAKSELGWRPTRSAQAVLEEFLAGLRKGEGERTAPLAPSAGDGA
jgi:UDP-glucose 4-epimerase